MALVKKCTKCNLEKDLSEFNNSNTNRFKFGKTPWCKECAKAYTKEYTERNKAARKAYNKQYKLDNKECLSLYNREYLKKYYLKNKDKLISKSSCYTKIRSKNDPLFRIARNLRRRLNNALRGSSKSEKTLQLLGCPIDFLKIHLESRFRSGMTWENYGKVWHIDHIKPLSKFNLLNEFELKECCNYLNLQPLFAKENLQKGKN